MFKTHGNVESMAHKDGGAKKDSLDTDLEGKVEADKDTNKETRRDQDRETRRERGERDREGKRRPESTTRKADTEAYHTYYLTGESDQEIIKKLMYILKRAKRDEKGGGDWLRHLKELTVPRHLL